MAKDYKIPYMLDCYGSLLTKKQKCLVDQYYNDDLSLAEISESEGITRQGVRDAIKRAEAQLLETEEKLHFIEKTFMLKKAAKGINVSDLESATKKHIENLLNIIEEL